MLSLVDPLIAQHDFKVDVRTRWRYVDQATQALGNMYFFPDCRPAELQLPDRDVLDSAAEARPFEVVWDDLANGKALVRVTGQGFGPDTTVFIGGRKLGADDALRVSADRSLSFQAPLKALIGDPFQIVGRFGNPRPLEMSFPGKENQVPVGITIKDPVKMRALDGNQVEVTLSKVCGLLRKEDSHPIVGIGGEAFVPREITEGEKDCKFLPPGGKTEGPPTASLQITVVVPFETIFKGDKVTLLEPFSPGNVLRANAPLDRQDLFLVEPAVDKIGDLDAGKVRLAIRGKNLKIPPAGGNGVMVTLGNETVTSFLPGSNPTLLLLEVDSKKLQGVNNLLITQGNAPARLVPIKPPEKAPELKLAADVHEGESVEVLLVGTLVDSVSKVLFEGRELTIHKEGGKLLVRLSETVTTKPGRRDLTAILNPATPDGPPRTQTIELTVLPAEKRSNRS